MKKTQKLAYITIGLLALAMFLPHALAGCMGFGPTEITGSNRRDTLVIATVSIVNKYSIAKYGVIMLEIPYLNKDTWQPVPAEQENIRVICKDCGHTMVRYEAIEDYQYPQSPLVGRCEECGSKNLIFYELIPRDEFQHMSFESVGAFELRKEGDLYITTEKIPPGATCNINILYDASTSYIKENEGKYWEVRPKATLREERGDIGVSVLSGIGIRTLIEFKMPLFLDVPSLIEKGKEFTVTVTYGNFEGTWREVPTNAIVSFLGITKLVDETGSATFTAPTTRKNYPYDITAEGAKYLSDTKVIVPVIIEEEAVGIISPILSAGVGIGLIVVLVTVCYFIFGYKRKKELKSE